MSVEDLAVEMADKFQAMMQGEISISPVHSNRASDIGHPCDMYGYLMRTRWAQQTPISWQKAALFGEGKLTEGEITQTLIKMGYRPQQQQRTFEHKGLQITGHPDAILEMPRLTVLEFKGLSDHLWKKLTSWDAMMKDHRHYVQQWPAQMTVYMSMVAEDKKMDWREVDGLWVMKNKGMGLLNFIPAIHDDALAHHLAAKCARINAAVRDGNPPEANPDPDTCPTCIVAHICPAVKPMGAGVQVIADDRLLEELDTWWETREARKEYEAADKTINKMVADRGNLIIGPYSITQKVVSGHREAQVAKDYTYSRKTIVRIGGQDGDSKEG